MNLPQVTFPREVQKFKTTWRVCVCVHMRHAGEASGSSEASLTGFSTRATKETEIDREAVFVRGVCQRDVAI